MKSSKFRNERIESLKKEVLELVLQFGDHTSAIYNAVCWSPAQSDFRLPDSQDRYTYVPDSLPDALARLSVTRVCLDASQRPYWEGLVFGLSGVDVEMDWDPEFPLVPVSDALYEPYLSAVRRCLTVVSSLNLVRTLKALWGLWVAASLVGGTGLSRRALGWYEQLSDLIIAKEGVLW